MSKKKLPENPFKSIVKSTVRPRSIGHSFLSFAKSKNNVPFNAENVLYVLSGRFTSKYAVERCAASLLKQELIRETKDGKWLITEKGKILVYQLIEIEKLTPFIKKFPGVKKDPILDSVD
jgi:hypothetical protein